MQSILADIIKSMTPLEWVAAATSLLCVYLTVRNNIWNWFWGFIGVILYGIIFWNYKNYANAGLQILYFLHIQFIGWYVWLRGGPNKNDDLPVSALTTAGRLGWTSATIVLTAALYAVLRLTQDPLPFADGVTTAMSIVAQYLQVHKRIENWWLWIAADIIYSLYVFPVQKLYVSTGLYVIFTVLAIIGALSWRTLLRAHRATIALEPGATPAVAVEPDAADA